jgi:glycosidase
MAASVLLTLPGTPYVYYGEEIGMPGTKPDENIRKPMLWSDGENAGFSTAKPWNAPARVRPGINVHYRRLIRLRQDHIDLRLGGYQAVRLANKNIYGYLRSYEQQTLLVLHNFSAETVPDLQLPPETKLKLLRDIGANAPCIVIPPLAAFETRIFEVAPVMLP